MTQEWDLEALRLLVLVGELGSLGQAARRLDISQPSASKRLAALERRLGLSLVDRSRRGSTLTATGRVVSDWSRRVLDEVDALHSGLEALRREHHAELRVAASLTVAEHLAPRWIGELRRRWTELHVGMRVTNSASVATLVSAGEVDVGFLEAPTLPPGLTARPVARDRLAVVVAPRHPWSRRRSGILPDELAAAPLVVREAGSGTRDTLEHALARAHAGPVRPALELGSTTAVRTAVTAGAGPAVLSVYAVAADLGEGRLVEVPVHDLDLRRVLHAVWPAGHQLLGPAADLVATASLGADSSPPAAHW